MKHELSDMLQDAKSGAPAPRYTVDDALKAGQKRQKQRRALWATTGSAAAVLAVVGAVAVPQLIPSSSPSSSPAAIAPAAPKAEKAAFTYPSGAFAGNIKGYQAGGLTVSDTVYVTPAYQVATLVAPGDGQRYEDADKKIHTTENWAGNLYTYAKGAFDPSVAQKGEKVGSGWYLAAKKEETGLPKGGVHYSNAQYTWEYADDSWAVVSVNGRVKPTSDALVAVAEGLTGGAAEKPVTINFKLGYVPAGYQIVAAGHSDESTMVPFEGQSSANLLKGTFPATGLTEPVNDTYHVGDKQLETLRITVYPAWYNKYDGPDDAAWCESESLCYRKIDGGKYFIELNGGGFVTDAELVKVLDQATFADPTDESTWFTVS